MVIADIYKFLHCLVESFFCPEFIQIDAFVFQSVKVPLHWCIVIRASGLAHALRYMDGFTELHERL